MEVNDRIPLIIIFLGISALMYVFTKDVIDIRYYLALAGFITLSSLVFLVVLPKLKDKVGLFSKLNLSDENISVKDFKINDCHIKLIFNSLFPL